MAKDPILEAHFNRQAPEHRLGDAPVENPFYVHLARAVDEVLNDGKKGNDRPFGFVMMIFPFNSHDGRCNYISNGADRRDVLVLMKEMIARFEGQPETKGRA